MLLKQMCDMHKNLRLSNTLAPKLISMLLLCLMPVASSLIHLMSAALPLIHFKIIPNNKDVSLRPA